MLAPVDSTGGVCRQLSLAADKLERDRPGTERERALGARLRLARIKSVQGGRVAGLCYVPCCVLCKPLPNSKDDISELYVDRMP